jgi:hypothetical protein
VVKAPFKVGVVKEAYGDNGAVAASAAWSCGAWDGVVKGVSRVVAAVGGRVEEALGKAAVTGRSMGEVCFS